MEFEDIFTQEDKSPKNFFITVLLCFFLGVFGAHRFYSGKIFTGIIMLFTAGGFGIWYIIDLIFLIAGRFEDGAGRKIKN